MVNKRSKKAARKKTKSAPKVIGKGKRGARYTTQQKQQVVDFVHNYNAKHGRGGQSQAAKKFALSVLTVASWLRSPQLSVSAKAGRASSVPSGINSKVASLIEVSDQLRKTEAEVTRLRAKYDELRSSIQSLL
ncbi:MAG: hypothetical protein ACPGIA_03045 [Luteolibacter sp.]